VEKEKSLFKSIKKNIIHLGYEDKIQAACSDASRWLKTNKQKFDVIFLDPPFDQIDYKVLIRTIYQSNVLNESGKVFLETNKHTELKLSKTLNILKEKTIGDVRLMILQ
jgi:16S rRNA (guanine966-N2)-methyltransferase